MIFSKARALVEGLFYKISAPVLTNEDLNGLIVATKKVEGWLTDEEGKLLFSLAKKCQGSGIIVEIGSWKGKSTIWLAKGSQAGNKLPIYAIDPHTGSTEHKTWSGDVWTYKEFKQNLKDAAVEDLVISITKTSEEAAKTFDKPVEFIFIDGAHEYEMVKKDFELWFPKVVEGGVIAFHDTTGWPGPKKVVREKFFNNQNFRAIGFLHSITYATKTSNLNFFNKLRNRFIFILKSAYDFYHGIKLYHRNL